eukprot:1006651-Lingulodinium_polyedra.AAC.1
MRPAPPAGWRTSALASGHRRSRAMLTAAHRCRPTLQVAGRATVKTAGRPGDLAAAARCCAKG